MGKQRRDVGLRIRYKPTESPSAIDMLQSRASRVFILGLLLVLATLGFYNPIVHNHFIDFDDASYILNNPHVVSGLTWANVKWAFTTSRDGNWHPLTWLSHAFDCQLFGLNPIGHHYMNLLLHVVNGVLLFLLLNRATGFTWGSLLVAALFALHPVNVESVAWAAERKNVLSMLFFLLALHVYDRYTRAPRLPLYLLVIVFYGLGLMAKPQVITLPFVLLLWDYWPARRMAGTGFQGSPPPRSFAYLVLEKLPLLILAAVDSHITMRAQRGGVQSLVDVPVALRLQNAVICYLRYIGEAFWPSHLAPLYPRPLSFPAWQVAGALALLLSVSAVVLHWRERRYLVVGWFWFLGTLIPMIGLITVGEQSMADRYAYISFIGLFVAAVWGLAAIAGKHRIPRVGWAGAALFALVVLGCLTRRQLAYWHDSETLWRYTLSVTEGNYVAHNNLGVALAGQGRANDALLEYRTGNALHRYKPLPLLGLALYELQLGHPEQAMEDCKAVLHDSPDPALQSSAWGELGQAYLGLHQYDQAAASYRTALQLNPKDSGALVGTGLMALRGGQFELAVGQFFSAVKVDSSETNMLLFSHALRLAGREAEADSALAQLQRDSSDLGRAQFEAAQLLKFAGLKPL
jgi:protein O-mannosyl-transferase